MKNLDLKKAANTVVLENLAATGPALDTAVAVQAQALQLTDIEYNRFKASVAEFRNIYLSAALADQQIANRLANRSPVVAAAAPAAPTAAAPAPTAATEAPTAATEAPTA